MAGIYKLTGKVQNYEWGGTQYISELLGLKDHEAKRAEYWLGAHVNAPSTVAVGDNEQPLNDFIKTDLEGILGKEIANKFHRLPFLFKVLDVNDMLSIQVHPTKKEAEIGFELENEMGIDLKAPHRNYKDDNHKPEVMVALSEFWLLHGFLPKKKLISNLSSAPELSHLLPIFESKGYYGLYQYAMEESAEQTNQVLEPLIKRILPSYYAGTLDKSNSDFWAAKAFETFCPKGNLDKGIYSIYFFNIVKAMPGQAVFQDAGIPHAYLEGQNMELMANSDNVLRGGLTPKYVDVEELLKKTSFNETVPVLIAGELQKDGIERIYPCPVPDFQLSQIAMSESDNYASKSKTCEIIIVMDGDLTVSNTSSSLSLNKGDAVFISADTKYTISTAMKAVVYKATAPI